MVPVEPTLAAVARPIRCGIGSNFIRRARCSTSGVSATQTTSLIRNADSTPDRPIVTASRPFGVAMRRNAMPISRSKKPDSRSTPTTIIMPNSRNSVLKSIDSGLTASSRLRTPVTSIERGADESDAGPVHAQPRHLAQRQPGIGQREDNPGQPVGPFGH